MRRTKFIFCFVILRFKKMLFRIVSCLSSIVSLALNLKRNFEKTGSEKDLVMFLLSYYRKECFTFHFVPPFLSPWLATFPWRVVRTQICPSWSQIFVLFSFRSISMFFFLFCSTLQFFFRTQRWKDSLELEQNFGCKIAPLLLQH